MHYAISNTQYAIRNTKNVHGIPFFQPKLTVNQPNDIYEQEADAVAEKVMRKEAPGSKNTFFSPMAIGPITIGPITTNIQRKCDHCEEEEKQLQRKPISENITPIIQTIGAAGAVVGNTLSNKISSTQGRGDSMDSTIQSFMNSRFGNDFSGVKIHTGGEAIQMNRDLNAKAFTTGTDIYFNEGQYQPNTDAGKHLLAHELTHVVQQKGIRPFLIQRAEIDYKQLTWADFKGSPPSGNAYDAETTSDIKYPDLTTIKPQITDTATDQDCTIGDKKDKQYEAKIKMDSSGIKAKAYMSQEKSWVKPLFKDPAEMKKYCKNDQFTIDEIANCKSTIQSTTASRDSNCKTVSDGCADAISKNQTFTVDIGEEHFEASTKDECAKVVAKCKEIFGKSIVYKTGKGNSITTEADCTTQLNKECLETRQEAADKLLSHEQGHFDITNVLATKLETDIKALVDAFAEKTVSACGKAEVTKQANDIVTKEVTPKIQDKIKEAQLKVDEIKGFYDATKQVDVPGKLKTSQDLYDTETTHGSVEAEQKKWKDKLSKGTVD